MGNRRDRQQARAKQRHKERRAARQVERKERTHRARAGYGEAGRAWSPAEAWLSEDWHEPGAHVAAVLTRTNDDGVYAYAAFEVDLTGPGLTRLDLANGVGLGNAQAAAAELGGERAMLEVDAETVARLLKEAAAHRRDDGERPLPGTDDALALVGDLDVDRAEYDLRWGDPELDDPTEEAPRPSLWSRLSGWFSG